MTAPTRAIVAGWRLDAVERSASDLDEVAAAFRDLISLATGAPDRISPSWSGHAANACRERLMGERESARRSAHELEDVADCLRSVGRRLAFATSFVESCAKDIEADPHQLTVSDSWAVNISPLALLPVPETDPERVRLAIVERQQQMDAAVRFLVDEDSECAALLGTSFERAAHEGRRLDQSAAFQRATGRAPETDGDWLTASMLDSFSEDAKYRGLEAGVVMGSIRAQPGMGTVRIELYIPVQRVFNLEVIPPGFEYDLGGLRTSDSVPTPGDARVEIVVDYEGQAPCSGVTGF